MFGTELVAKPAESVGIEAVDEEVPKVNKNDIEILH